MGTAWLQAETAPVPAADGFDLPVGKNGKVYHKARGYQPNGHLGEDWDGAGGGDTDLGDPVYCIGTGLVVFARDYRVGWGNVIIVRHAYVEEGELRFIDSLYGHLDKMLVPEGTLVKRGQQIGTIGNNYGMYEAHLHFEIRKNLAIGMNRSAFARDLTCYFDPTAFVESHRQLERGGEIAQVPVKTFVATSTYAGPEGVETNGRLVLPVPGANGRPPSLRQGAPPASGPRGPFFVDRFSDMRKQ